MIIFFKPVFVDKIWGGNNLKEIFGYDTGDTCGEVWGISAHASGESIVLNGEFKGYSLSKLFNKKKNLFGYYQGREFPILVKLIDAKKDLSIQVHPNDEQAKKYNSLGKSECWYILKAQEGTEIVIGHHARTTEELEKLIKEKKYAKLLNKLAIKKGDYFYIDSGTIHAICANTVLLEVQQSSDITFRVYDYDRLDANNELRPLHIKQSLECINTPSGDVARSHNNKFFEYEILDIGKKAEFTAHNHGDYLVVLKGQGFINDYKCQAGDFVMVSAKDKYYLTGDMQVQKTWFH